MTKRITKRQRYINSLEFDIKALEGGLALGKYRFMYEGEWFTRAEAKQRIADCLEEIKNVKENKQYQPYITWY